MAAGKSTPKLPEPNSYLTDGVNLVQFLGIDDEDKLVVEDCALDADDPAALKRLTLEAVLDDWQDLDSWLAERRSADAE